MVSTTTYQKDFKGCPLRTHHIQYNPEEFDYYDGTYNWEVFKPLPKKTDEVKLPANAVDLVSQMYKKRLQTVYQVTICDARNREEIQCAEGQNSSQLAAQLLMKDLDKVYFPKGKIPQPLQYARRSYGLYNPCLWRTGVTEYAGVIGFTGYNDLKCGGKPQKGYFVWDTK